MFFGVALKGFGRLIAGFVAIPVRLLKVCNNRDDCPVSAGVWPVCQMQLLVCDIVHEGDEQRERLSTSLLARALIGARMFPSFFTWQDAETIAAPSGVAIFFMLSHCWHIFLARLI